MGVLVQWYGFICVAMCSVVYVLLQCREKRMKRMVREKGRSRRVAVRLESGKGHRCECVYLVRGSVCRRELEQGIWE